MCGFFLGSELFLGVHSSREFAEGGNAWKIYMLVALGLLITGGALMGLAT